MRTRVKSPPTHHPRVWVRPSGDTYENQVIYPTYEKMDDVSNGTSRPVNSPCQHLKCSLTPRFYDSAWYGPGSSYRYRNHYLGCGAGDVALKLMTLVPIDHLAQLEYELDRDIFDRHARLYETWSILNAGLEASEIPQLLSSIGETLVDTVRSIRNRNYLEYQFGFVPLMNDIYALYENVRRALNVVPQRLAAAEQPTRYSMTRFLPMDDIIHLDVGGSSNCLISGRFTYRKLRATGTLVVQYPELRGALGSLYQTLDLLGIHPDLQTVWDASLYSWLIDWIVPIGDALESLHRRGWTNPDITVLGSQSVKVAADFKLYASDQMRSSLLYSDVGAQPLAVGGQFSFYARTGKNSIDESVPQIAGVPGLSPMRTAILGSILQGYHRVPQDRRLYSRTALGLLSATPSLGRRVRQLVRGRRR